jgi:hypothetical protein
VDGELQSRATYADNKAYYWPSFLIRFKDSFRSYRRYDYDNRKRVNEKSADLDFKEQLKERYEA